MDAEDVAVILDDITNRLAPASQAAWDILVSQIIISSWFAAIAGAVGILFGLTSVVIAWRLNDPGKENNKWDKQDKWLNRAWFSVMCVMFGIVPGAVLIYNGVVGIIIPEYHLLNKFLNILSGS